MANRGEPSACACPLRVWLCGADRLALWGVCLSGRGLGWRALGLCALWLSSWRRGARLGALCETVQKVGALTVGRGEAPPTPI